MIDYGYSPIKFTDYKLYLLDQRKLPTQEVFVEISDFEGGYQGIRDMIVRGAPCIGFTAVYTLALWLRENLNFEPSDFRKACDRLKESRPTAVNLGYEVDKVFNIVSANLKNAYETVVRYGDEQLELSYDINKRMSSHVAKDLETLYGKRKLNILTHCNTGLLACGTFGTALGAIQYLHEEQRINNVWVDETRPYLQGSRLTAFELNKQSIPHKIVVEGAASYLMKNEMVDAIVVGADRISKNGDTANKIGTSNLAIIAHYYDIPFYVLAPKSSFDINSASGQETEIELRLEQEILEIHGSRIAPAASEAFNPSFDITAAHLITGISCEDRLLKFPYTEKIEGLFNESL